MKLFNPVEFKKENVKKTMYGSIFKYISLQHCIKLILKVLRNSQYKLVYLEHLYQKQHKDSSY